MTRTRSDHGFDASWTAPRLRSLSGVATAAVGDIDGVTEGKYTSFQTDGGLYVSGFGAGLGPGS
jgi:hypothetical protein